MVKRTKKVGWRSARTTRATVNTRRFLAGQSAQFPSDNSGMRLGMAGWSGRKLRWEGWPAQMAKACLPIGSRWEASGLLRSHLLVVMMMVVMMVMMPVVMTMMMMLLHRGCISAGGAEDRHGERQGQSQPERGEEGLFHDFVSFLRGRSGIHRTKSATPSLAIGTILLVFFDNFSQM